jgi:peptide methionine sulfoxide reductase MsrB
MTLNLTNITEEKFQVFLTEQWEIDFNEKFVEMKNKGIWRSKADDLAYDYAVEKRDEYKKTSKS